MREIIKTLSGVSGRDIQRALNESESDSLCLVNAQSAELREECRDSAQRLKSDSKLNVVLHVSRKADHTISAWEMFPPRLAALRENPEPILEAIVLRTSFVEEIGEVLDISEPLWDLIIRASKLPGSIQVRRSSVQSRIENPNLPRLTPDPPGASRAWLESHLQAVSPEELVPRLTSRPDGIALKAGLLQIHDDLDASHELSQSIEGEGRHRAGDYWHAIMHRREPDYGNSKYWFRRVGSHPIFESMADLDKLLFGIRSLTEYPASAKAREKLFPGGRWDALAFVDFCQEASRSEDPQLIDLAERMQWGEMMLLLEQTYHDASQ